jgi:hypothetical protein
MEVSAMSLSARDQQALNSMEHRLAPADPRLASLLATFTRLADGEALPAREKIRAGGQRITRPLLGLPHRGRAATSRRSDWLRAWPWLWLALSIALIASALVSGHGHGRGLCPQWALLRASACTGQAAPGWHSVGEPQPSAAVPATH